MSKEAASRQKGQSKATGEVSPSGQPMPWEEAEAEEEGQPLSRRAFLSGSLAGGAVGLVIATGTGVAVWRAMDIQAQQALEAAEADIRRLQGLVALYEKLERVGLDAAIETGMAAVSLPLGAVEWGAQGLKRGLELIEEALRGVGSALPSARDAIAWLEERVAALADGISNLEQVLQQFLEVLAGSPLVAALGKALDSLLDRLPFEIGAKFRGVRNALVGLVTSIDDFVRGVNSRLLEPMRTVWFGPEAGKGIEALLVDPLIRHVLDPLEAHLADLAALADAWQQTLMAPAQRALRERAQVRLEIARYKREHSID